MVTMEGRFEKDNLKEQYADYTLTINTQVNTNENEIHDVFTKKDRFEETDVTTLSRGTSRTSPGPPSTVAPLWVVNCPRVPTSTYQPQPHSLRPCEDLHVGA